MLLKLNGVTIEVIDIICDDGKQEVCGVYLKEDITELAFSGNEVGETPELAKILDLAMEVAHRHDELGLYDLISQFRA